MFDVSRSGEAGERYKTLSSRKSKDGQKGTRPLGSAAQPLQTDLSKKSACPGIISALALDPSQQGLLAAGSYSGQIALHDTKSSEIAPALVFNTTETTGVTQVKTLRVARSDKSYHLMTLLQF
jgi:hypothetical protein